MIRKHLMVSVVILLSIISSSGYAASPKQQEEPVYAANFNYIPESQVAPGSAGVTFAVGSPVYLSGGALNDLWLQELVAIKKVSNKPDAKIPWSSFSQFDNLDKALKDNLSALLLAKGFNVRGPYDSYDLIPYPDKKDTDLYLVPTLDLTLAINKEEWSGALLSGEVEVSGKAIFELREIVTRELMWAKSIPFTKFTFPYSIRGSYHVENKFNLIMNEVAKGVEQQYPNLMATISKLIYPEEMQIIKKQCQELKSKKGY